jgi:hypothetical protein
MSTKIEVKHPATGEAHHTYDVFCGWGEGPDVGINLQRKAGSHKHYADLDFIPMDFTADQAEALAKALLDAAAQAREWDKSLNEYFEAHKDDPESPQQEEPF